ncbi:MAG: trypsin-like peptidase domain-containing protein [Candidatus Omnitrophica bacterium]|nr:trypsin-like peptidase domain-containing protein [Candidatus Omnitrophota bacterium]
MKKKIFFGLTFLAVGLLVGVAQAADLPSKDFGMDDAIISVANSAGRAVVSISTEHTAKIKRYNFGNPFGGQSPFGQDDPFRKFFDDFSGGMPDTEYKQTGLGSGVIIDSEGYILTNEHVINGADKATVTLPDGREFKAELKGRDPRSDLAIIKIDAHNLPVATLGDSNSVKIGQWVVAIGNPFGFALQNPEPTVTVGVISALHRSLGRVISGDRDYGDLIQTDAAINPGNSGGPLVNLKGEVVGINVAIFSTSGGYQGIGFAIPVNNAKKIITRLIEGKKILYGWLGVTVQDLTDDLAKYFGLKEKQGVLIAKVLKDGPAEKAGLKESDIIKQFNNTPINNVKELLSTVAAAEVGKKIKIVVMRDKKEVALQVEVGERPQDLEQAAAEIGASEGWRGLKVEEKKGVLVVDVEPGSPADEAGIVRGDLIREINKRQIQNIADYNSATKGLKGDALVKTERGFYIIKEKESGQ